MRFALPLALVCFGTLTPFTAQAQTTWDMSVFYSQNREFAPTSLQFAKEIAASTGGKLVIDVNLVGGKKPPPPHLEIKSAVRSGRIPIGEVLAAVAGRDSPIYRVDALYFVTNGYADARRLYEAQKPFLERRLDAEGLKLLYSAPGLPDGLFGRREITSIAQLSGAQILAPNAETIRAIQLMKARPVNLPTCDIPGLFGLRSLTESFGTPALGMNMEIWKYVTHYHDVKARLLRSIVFVNKSAFEKLPTDQQQAVLSAAAEAEKSGWASSEKEADRLTKLLAKNKIAIVQPTPQLRAALSKVGSTMMREWEKSAGADGTALLKAYRGK